MGVLQLGSLWRGSQASGQICQSDFNEISLIFKCWLRLTLGRHNSKVCKFCPHRCWGNKHVLGWGPSPQPRPPGEGVGRAARDRPSSLVHRPQQLATCHVLLPSSGSNRAHRIEYVPLRAKNIKPLEENRRSS